MASSFWRKSWVPWDEPKEWVLWFLGGGLAAIFVHNFVRVGKKKI